MKSKDLMNSSISSQAKKLDEAIEQAKKLDKSLGIIDPTQKAMREAIEQAKNLDKSLGIVDPIREAKAQARYFDKSLGIVDTTQTAMHQVIELQKKALGVSSADFHEKAMKGAAGSHQKTIRQKGDFNEMADSKFTGTNDKLLRNVSPQISMLPIPKDQNLASEFHRRLIKLINDFDATLDQDHEVGVRLVSFGQTVIFHLSDISYWNPSLISFIGIKNEGEPVELIQHVSQISILLMKLKRLDPSKPKQKIGFRSEKTEKETVLNVESEA